MGIEMGKLVVESFAVYGISVMGLNLLAAFGPGRGTKDANIQSKQLKESFIPSLWLAFGPVLGFIIAKYLR